MTEASNDPTIRTIPSLLAEVYVRLLGELLAAESAAFGAESAMPTPRGETATFLAELEEAKAVLADVLDELMIHRLGTSRGKEPLLHPSDADHVVRIVFEDAEMDEDAARDMTASRTVVDVMIAERIIFLKAISNDLYFAFDKFVAALVSVIYASGNFYSPVVQRIEARNAIYHGCMTPDSWQRRTKASVALIIGLSLDRLSEGGVSDGMEVEAAAIVEAVMLAADNAATQIRDNTAQRLDRYYNRRQKEIWPTRRRG